MKKFLIFFYFTVEKWWLGMSFQYWKHFHESATLIEGITHQICVQHHSVSDKHCSWNGCGYDFSGENILVMFIEFQYPE